MAHPPPTAAADPSATDSNGNTALHIAAATGNDSLVALLLGMIPLSLLSCRSEMSIMEIQLEFSLTHSDIL